MVMLKLLFTGLFVATLFFAGCNGKPQQSQTGQGSKVLARVNGTPLTPGDVAFRLELAHGNKPQYGDKSIDDIINQELLYQQGLKLGLDKDPSYIRKFGKPDGAPSGARRLEMARRVFNTQIASHIDVSYLDGKEYYDKHEERISTELHLHMIKADKRADAEEALKKIRSGAAFESAAQSMMGSVLVNGRKPWDLGFVKWENIPVDFEEQIYALKPGEVSNILGSQPTGFQIVKMIESRKAPKTNYPGISAIVMNHLRDMKLLTAYNTYVENLRKNAKIEKF
jgi:parvulin-like peptidyl-prolyl isomerase